MRKINTFGSGDFTAYPRSSRRRIGSVPRAGNRAPPRLEIPSAKQEPRFRITVEIDRIEILQNIHAWLPQGARLSLAAAPLASDDPFAALTIRQKDVLRLLMQNRSNKEIGRTLALSHFTVRNHVSQIFRLLDVPSRKVAIVKFADRFPDAMHEAVS